ncbi:MAG: HpcH/HpaI aldolase family protein [Pirellulaceae bacterium]|jgi:2-dehydro-3-deoxyglucarate aldolase/4-hydroxy-2-oxoheptanedioate aldolase
MYDNIQAFKNKMDAGQLCVGPTVSFSDASVTEALAATADYIWIDLEHSPTNFESMVNHIIACRACSVPGIVRVPSGEIAWVKRVLDAGAEGIILPQAQTVAEVQEFVNACRYPMQGTRGYGPRRSTNYGRIENDTYLSQANRETFVVGQIESRTLVDNIDALVSIDGLDGVVIGPYDLSGSYDLPGEIDHPTVVEAIQLSIDKCREAGVYVGVGMGSSAATAKRWHAAGANWAMVGADYQYMVQFADDLYKSIRKS